MHAWQHQNPLATVALLAYLASLSVEQHTGGPLLMTTVLLSPLGNFPPVFPNLSYLAFYEESQQPKLALDLFPGSLTKE